MHSPHEGCAVIREEFEELWDAVKAHHSNVVEMCNEAVQVTAMAIRFLHDVTPGFFKYPSCPEKVPKLKWQTGELPEGELVIFEVKIYDSEYNGYLGYNVLGEMVDVSGRHILDMDDCDHIMSSDDVTRWVLYSDFLKVVE